MPRLQDLEDTVDKLQGDLENLQTHVETLDKWVKEIGTDLQSLKTNFVSIEQHHTSFQEQKACTIQGIWEYIDGKLSDIEACLEDKVAKTEVMHMLEEFDRQVLKDAKNSDDDNGIDRHVTTEDSTARTITLVNTNSADALTLKGIWPAHSHHPRN